jgi:hypothetical protein
MLGYSWYIAEPGWSIANKSMESIFNNRYPIQCKLANPLFTAIFTRPVAWVDN